MLRLVSLAAIVLLVLLGGGACQRRSPERDVPPWLASVALGVTSTRPSFEGNTEVFVDIQNTTGSQLVITGLNAPGAATLVREDGSQSGIHRLSVGVTKPIVVAPHGSKKTSLLFSAGAGRARRLVLYDHEFEAPAPAR